MVETTAALGEYTELVENDAGESILRNTNTGTEVKLADFIDLVGPLGSESEPVAGTSHFEALTAVEETVTGETLIRARRANSVTGISANEWTNIADTELDDNRDELNGLTINVDKDGFYHLFAAVHFLNVADGDRIDFALRNTSSSSLVDLTRDPRQIAAGSEDGMDINTVVKLSSGVDYEVQARSIDGSFDIIEPSYFSLVRSLVQP